MLLRLFLLFTLVPLADLLLLLMISKQIPMWATVLIVVGTGLTGAWLAKRQWKRVKSRIQSRLQVNQMPGELITDGMLILLAGGLLIAPGLITDALGISLLISFCRGWYKRRAIDYLKEHFKVESFPMPSQAGKHADDIVDGEVVDHPEPSADSFRDDGDSQIDSPPRIIESTLPNATSSEPPNDSATS